MYNVLQSVALATGLRTITSDRTVYNNSLAINWLFILLIAILERKRSRRAWQEVNDRRDWSSLKNSAFIYSKPTSTRDYRNSNVPLNKKSWTSCFSKIIFFLWEIFRRPKVHGEYSKLKMSDQWWNVEGQICMLNLRLYLSRVLKTWQKAFKLLTRCYSTWVIF